MPIGELMMAKYYSTVPLHMYIRMIQYGISEVIWPRVHVQARATGFGPQYGPEVADPGGSRTGCTEGGDSVVSKVGPLACMFIA